MTPDKSRNSDSRQNEISEISRSLKILAKEVNVPVLALSQLSRAVETRKGRPQLSDLRESGAIEQDADIVMFIHRPDKVATEKELASGNVKQNVAEIIIEKHRNGPQGVVELYFKGECTKFLNLEDGDAPAKKENGNSEEAKAVIKEEIKSDYESEEVEEVTSNPEANVEVKSIDQEIFG